MLNVLQHRGFHSLYLRLAFWINKLMKLMFQPRQTEYRKEPRSFEFQGFHTMQMKSIILFLRHQQEIVDNMVKLRVTEKNDFEWASKLKLIWTEGDDVEASCGGWSQRIGYEYLGTKQRLIIMPLTERYFVFISSVLRQKQSVMFQCIPEHQMGADLVEEFATLCAVPFKSFQCGPHNTLSSMTQILNGCAMANVWVFFEHMDALPSVSLSILLKEI